MGVTISGSAEETERMGYELARVILEGGIGSNVLALSGELGSGKTTFVQGLARGLGIGGKIISPTFILVKSYKLGEGKTLRMLHHVDLYRLAGEDIESLGLSELWGDSSALVVIEWADKAGGKLPREAVWVSFSVISDERRKLVFKGGKNVNVLIH